MLKILFLALAVWIVISILKSYSRNIDSDVKKPVKPESMVQCSECGVHLPKSDSISEQGNYYCSEAHSKLHKP
ncbi:MAG: PP0621 family protein [Methylophilaceae bacterium]